MLILSGIFIFLLNLPFGLWRTKLKKFSFKWFLAIHITIPVIILIRHYTGMGYDLITYPIMSGSFFFGQFVGGRILPKLFPVKADN